MGFVKSCHWGHPIPYEFEMTIYTLGKVANAPLPISLIVLDMNAITID